MVDDIFEIEPSIKEYNSSENILKEQLEDVNYMVAGGYALSKYYTKKNKTLEYSDLDVYFETEEMFNKAKEKFDNLIQDPDRKYESKFAITYNLPNGINNIQLIKRVKKFKETLEDFDIECCKIGYINLEEKIEIGDRKSLKLNRNIKLYTTTLTRLFKYLNKMKKIDNNVKIDDSDCIYLMQCALDGKLEEYYDDEKKYESTIAGHYINLLYYNPELLKVFDVDEYIPKIVPLLIKRFLGKRQFSNYKSCTLDCVDIAFKTPRPELMKRYPEFYI